MGGCLRLHLYVAPRVRLKVERHYNTQLMPDLMT
jgi:hypothetical protein